MLTCHIDIEIIRHAEVEYGQNKRPKHGSFIAFLESDCHINIYGFDSSIESEFSNENAEIYDIYIEGRESSKISVDESSLEIFHYNSNNLNPYQLFFFNETDLNKQKNILSKIPLLVGFVNNYQEVFNKFGDIEFIRSHYDNFKNEYTDLSKLFKNLPITELIISDSYLVKSYPSYPLENNYYKLLNYISSNLKKLKRVIIISYDDKKNWDDDSNLDEIKLKSQEILGDGIRFRFVQYRNKNIEHDRHIFTNYFRTNLGSSINRINNQYGESNVQNSSFITLFPFNKAENMSSSIKILEDMKETIDSENKKTLPEGYRIYTSPLFFII